VTTPVQSPGVGRVVEVLVAEGAWVEAGRELVVVESMKVEIPVTAPVAGRVVSLVASVDATVQAGDVLVVLGS
jgi:biotin carboxyl carrier protein